MTAEATMRVTQAKKTLLRIGAIACSTLTTTARLLQTQLVRGTGTHVAIEDEGGGDVHTQDGVGFYKDGRE